jgi:hypothetical protein
MTEKRIVLLAFLILLAFAAFLSASTMSVLVAAHLAGPVEIPEPRPFLAPPLEEPKPIAHFPAPKTPVCDGSSAPKVRLLATFVGDQDAHAVIELEGTVHVLAAGERVDDNELWEIARGGATLKRSCDAQTLAFDDKLAPGPARPASVSLNVDDVMSRIDQLAKDARFSPKMENGAMSIRVMSIRPGSLFDSAGLKNGDLVESVDGMPIFELGNMGAINELKAKRMVNVRIKRGREVIQIPVSLY